MVTLQVYSFEPVGIGSVLSKASTSARTPVHCSPVPPLGKKANVVAPVLIASLAGQSGRPLALAAIETAAPMPPEKVMSFCVPATWTSVVRVTSILRPGWPTLPLVEPMWITVPPRGGLVGVGVGPPPPPTLTVPLVHVAAIGAPPGSLAPGFAQVRGRLPDAPVAMAMLQVYNVAPSAIGSVLSNARTSARTPVQAAPVQPEGWKANVVAPLLMASFTAQ